MAVHTQWMVQDRAQSTLFAIVLALLPMGGGAVMAEGQHKHWVV
jgi:hypothetical protein